MHACSKLIAVASVPILLAGGAPPGTRPVPADVPAWFDDEVRWRVTGDSVRWEADNRQWQSADEPFEAYGMRFWRTLDRKGIRGVLFGIRDGVETRPFSEFRLFWHPGRQQVAVMQWDAWGGHGEGVLKQPADGVTRLEQVMWRPGGSEVRTAHDSRREGTAQVDQQLSWSEGSWSPGRTYTWTRQAVSAPAEGGRR